MDYKEQKYENNSNQLQFKNKQWYVYIHINKINGKVYIGQTCQDPKYRWGSGGKGYKRNKHFWSAIKMYGWYNFEHKILLQGLTKEDAIYKERKLIALYDSTNPNKGYNASTGGECGLVGVVVSDETKKKISDALKGRYVSEDTRKKMSESMRGKNNHNYNKRLSDDHKNKLIEATMIPVLQLDKVGNRIAEYISIAEAARLTGLNKGGICECCKGKRKTLGGFKWQYKNSDC